MSVTHPFCNSALGISICDAIQGTYKGGLHAVPTLGQPAVPPTCTVVARRLEHSTVPEDRDQCLKQRPLPDGRTGADCYKTATDSDGMVTTAIVLDDYCILNADRWYGCIIDNPVPYDGA